MSTLVLVRHAQAAPSGGGKTGTRPPLSAPAHGAAGTGPPLSTLACGAAGLSPTGDEQARRLGAYWARQGERFDAVFSGTLARQLRTAELAGAAVREAGLPWPGVEDVAELAEYDADGILEVLAPLLEKRDEPFRALVEACRGGGEGPQCARDFQRMFEAVMAGWCEGSLEARGVESWPSFRERVERALRRVTSGNGRGRRIAVFTSGGPIGVIVQRVVGAPERAALDLNWRVRNCSLSEITFSGARFALDCFNALPHLPDRGLWTYR